MREISVVEVFPKTFVLFEIDQDRLLSAIAVNQKATESITAVLMG